MKRRLEPGQLAAIAARGRTREPASLACYRRGERGNAGVLGSFPHGRYCLVVDLDCRRTGDTRVLDTRVHRLYRAMLPWLLIEPIVGEGAQQWLDLVALIDELMDREDELFASAAPWPLGELTSVLEAVAGLLARERNPYRAADFSDGDYDALGVALAGHTRELAEHRECCSEAQINVHWW